MKAIYRRDVVRIVGEASDGVVLDTGEVVAFGDRDLILDPTDEQVDDVRDGRPPRVSEDEVAELLAVAADFGIELPRPDVEEFLWERRRQSV